jgi:acetyltransferase-like isoleucine patch superfamily enzyme
MKLKKLSLKRKEKKKIDLDSTESTYSGLAGLFEKIMRKFKILIHLLSLMPMYLVASLCIGISFWPAVQAFKLITSLTSAQPSSIQALGYGVSLGLGYFIYGFSLLFVTGLFNFILRANIKPWRGQYTPFNLIFYRMMGMKIGRGCQINTVNISDPSLIELGDKVTIGGSVTIVAHYGVSGILILAPVKIGHAATIGLRAIIMGDVEIGDGARILPNSVVMPKSRIPAGEIWGGVPAVKIHRRKAA